MNMKRYSLSFILLFFLCATRMSGNDLDLSLKYGKVTMDELTMETYAEDSTANAVVLYKTGVVYYDFVGGSFKVVYEMEHKVKILTTDGVGEADVILPLYNDKTQNNYKDALSKLEANAYNLEDGKIVKTKMSKDYVFDERVSPYWKQVKFSIPGVKAGTVIEYKYKIVSDRYHTIFDWEIQESIPVHFSKYEVTIPNYFHILCEMKGYEPIKGEETVENRLFLLNFGGLQSEQVNAPCKKYIFETGVIPALKDEYGVWCLEDFETKVRFDFKGYQFPGAAYKSYSRTWDDIDQTLVESDWSNTLNMRNPFKEEMKALPLDGMSNKEKVVAVFDLLRSKMRWSNKYAFYAEHVKQAVKEGTGSNSEMNFVLLSMLKDAGVQAYPIVMSTRSRGRLPMTYPSLNKLNTFIVGARDTDSTMVYLDGSILYGSLNDLPPELMVDRARIFNPKQRGDKWVDLTAVGRNVVRLSANVSLDSEGVIRGKRQISLTGVYAANYKRNYLQAKDSAEFVDNLQRDIDVTISSYSSQGAEKHSNNVRETFEFTKNCMSTGDHIYLTPMIFKHIDENRFTSEERKLPVEFAYPYEFRLNSNIMIPEGYEVEEMPEPIRLSNDDGSLNCLYTISQMGNVLTVNYQMQMKRILFSQMEYDVLKFFWEKMVEKNNEQVILRKKTEL